MLRLARRQCVRWMIYTVSAHLTKVENLATSRRRLLNLLGAAVIKLFVPLTLVAVFMWHVLEVQSRGALSLTEVTIVMFEIMFISVSPLIFMVRLEEVSDALLTTIDVLTIKRYRPRMERRLARLKTALSSS